MCNMTYGLPKERGVISYSMKKRCWEVLISERGRKDFMSRFETVMNRCWQDWHYNGCSSLANDSMFTQYFTRRLTDVSMRVDAFYNLMVDADCSLKEIDEAYESFMEPLLAEVEETFASIHSDSISVPNETRRLLGFQPVLYSPPQMWPDGYGSFYTTEQIRDLSGHKIERPTQD